MRAKLRRGKKNEMRVSESVQTRRRTFIYERTYISTEREREGERGRVRERRERE